MSLSQQIEEVVQRRNWGEPSAMKRGRFPHKPYVPVILGTPNGGRDNREQILGWAFATREEAVKHAAATIRWRKTHFADQLAEPRCRALREQWGLPKEIQADALV